jgi:hypothetical protein
MYARLTQTNVLEFERPAWEITPVDLDAAVHLRGLIRAFHFGLLGNFGEQADQSFLYCVVTEGVDRAAHVAHPEVADFVILIIVSKTVVTLERDVVDHRDTLCGVVGVCLAAEQQGEGIAGLQVISILGVVTETSCELLHRLHVGDRCS